MPITFDNVTINNGITINYDVTTVTGGNLTFDGSYSVRKFTSEENTTLGISGGNLTFDYLVVGPGGPGGSTAAGFGGGAGGGGGGEVLIGNTTFNSGNYNVRCGNFITGSSLLNSFTAHIGYSGDSAATKKGGDSAYSNVVYIGGTGSTSGGGGAGQGANGQSVSGTTGGNGGIGISSSITGTSTYYGAGGGGGGTVIGGTGGGGGAGNGAVAPSDGGDATVNTGGGGGGAARISTGSYSGGTGGTGVVVIRYLTAGTN
jgi:hypothetical protein